MGEVRGVDGEIILGAKDGEVDLGGGELRAGEAAGGIFPGVEAGLNDVDELIGEGLLVKQSGLSGGVVLEAEIDDGDLFDDGLTDLKQAVDGAIVAGAGGADVVVLGVVEDQRGGLRVDEGGGAGGIAEASAIAGAADREIGDVDVTLLFDGGLGAGDVRRGGLDSRAAAEGEVDRSDQRDLGEGRRGQQGQSGGKVEKRTSRRTKGVHGSGYGYRNCWLRRAAAEAF